LSGSPVVFVATSKAPPNSTVRIVTFGDSNTDLGFAGTNPNPVAASYVSSASDIRTSSNTSYQLAGKIEARWRAQSSKSIVAVNHGISATSSGDGRTPHGAPNALTQVGGITRFAGEVLGAAYPWSGGEPTNGFYASGAIARVQAFSPGSSDFVYVSIGTNDLSASISPSATAANLASMIDQWVNSGHGSDHFILTTLAPASGNSAIPQINSQIRSLAAARAVRLIDLAARTSNDNGATWRSAADTVDGLHYSETVRDWIADQVVSYMLVIVPQ
jgi:lysophospholipase L1-like esterase